MSLQDQLLEDMKQAMRAKDTITLGVIRFLRAEIKNIEIDQGEIDDAAVTKVILKQIKQMQEATAQFTQGGRGDLAAAEQEKISVLQKYVPAPLTQEELERLIDEVIAASDAPAIKTVMPAVMAKVAGRAEGSTVSQLVRSKL